MAFESGLAAAPGFTLVCPGYRPAGLGPGASTTQGCLAFAIGSQVVAELGDEDLVESWAAAEELSAAELAALSEVAAGNLLDLLASGITDADLSGAVTDAAVVLLLAMKRHGISDPKRIPACTVTWSGNDVMGRVAFSA
jgi:hypothetical protein